MKVLKKSIILIFVLILIIFCSCKTNDDTNIAMEINISDFIIYTAEHEDGGLEEDDILQFDVGASYGGVIKNGIYEGSSFIISENRSMFGYDGVVIYQKDANSDRYYGFLFAVPNITYTEYLDILNKIEIFTGHEISFFESYSESIEIADKSDIYNTADYDNIINDSTLNIHTNSIIVEMRNQDDYLAYAISTGWVGENIFKQRFTEVFPWHKSGETIYNELYIRIHYPPA